MLTLKNKVSELAAKSREGLNFIGFKSPDADTQYPCLRLRIDEMISTGKHDEYTVAFQVFFPWPDNCLNYLQAIELTDKEVDLYYKMLEEMLLLGFVEYGGYELTSSFKKRIFDGKPVTEHNLVVVQLETKLRIKSAFECCVDGTFFDFETEAAENENPWGKT